MKSNKIKNDKGIKSFQGRQASTNKKQVIKDRGRIKK